MTILKEYVAAVTTRADYYKEAESYYDGQVSDTFTYRNAKLRRVLSTTGFRGTHNYCRVVVDAVLNRLEIANIVADTKRATDKITEVWDLNNLNLEANEIHRRALEFGDCYALVWPDEEGQWRISYSSPRNTALVYDPERPWEKLYAVKMWKDKVAHDTNANPRTRMNVYTADAIHKYVADTDFVSLPGNGIADCFRKFGLPRTDVAGVDFVIVEIVAVERARIGLFVDDDALVAAQLPRQLVGPDVDRIDARGTLGQQHVGETPGRASDIERHRAGHVDREMTQPMGELDAAARHPRMIAPLDDQRGAFGQQIARLGDPAVPGEDIAGQDQRLRPGAAFGETLGDEQLVGADPGRRGAAHLPGE